MKRRNVLSVVIASTAIVGLAAAGVAFATPGSKVTSVVEARGFAEEKVMTRGNQPYDVVVQTLTFEPGGTTGWHTHPGMVVAVVKSGTLTVYDADDKSCTPQVFGAGQVYVDHGYGHVHIARNEGATATEVKATYLDVPIGEPVRIDADDPGNCSFPP